MLTMPRNYWPLPGPPGERRAVCDYCGITWYRSSMRRDESGFLACPDDQDGRDVVQLNRLNQEAAQRSRLRRDPGENW